jgi:hypothetical protein
MHRAMALELLPAPALAGLVQQACAVLMLHDVLPVAPASRDDAARMLC